jgi:hypothetical protein
LHPTRLGLVVLTLLALTAVFDAIGQWTRAWQLVAQAVEVTPTTFPQLAPIVDDLRSRFDLPRTRVYVSRDAPPNGYTIGVRQPVAIQTLIGRRPIAAFGNSDGDYQMLQWTSAASGRRLMGLVDHTDADREFTYCVSPMGRLETALDEAQQRGWLVVDMKADWKRILAFQ